LAHHPNPVKETTMSTNSLPPGAVTDEQVKQIVDALRLLARAIQLNTDAINRSTHLSGGRR
jgi:hypothetical protein